MTLLVCKRYGKKYYMVARGEHVYKTSKLLCKISQIQLKKVFKTTKIQCLRVFFAKAHMPAAHAHCDVYNWIYENYRFPGTKKLARNIFFSELKNRGVSASHTMLRVYKRTNALIAKHRLLHIEDTFHAIISNDQWGPVKTRIPVGTQWTRERVMGKIRVCLKLPRVHAQKIINAIYRETSVYFSKQ